jgi:hypothetical protein
MANLRFKIPEMLKSAKVIHNRLKMDFGAKIFNMPITLNLI